MHEIYYTDRSFNLELAAEYSLSVQANLSGFTYTVCDNNSNLIVLFKRHRFDQVILLSDLTKNISEIFEKDSTLGLSYSRIRFLGYSRQTTLIPEAYFEEEQNRKYLAFNDAGEPGGRVFSNLISPPGIYNVFSLPDELVSQITLFFKKVEFLSQTTTFLRHVTKDMKTSVNSSVYVGLNPEFFDIACTGHGKLLLYNTFQYANETDLLYFILFVYKCMHFEPEKVPLVISGELSSKLSYLDILRQYFAQTICDDESAAPMLASGLKQLNVSRFLNLLNVNMCESSVENTEEKR
ncbi:MAG TPA: DUF3822 family protein [Bacteroidales bacterium]|jgi:hypothetical protein|nr:DUF3822 family protein [Bacteroidales bacterium]